MNYTEETSLLQKSGLPHGPKGFLSIPETTTETEKPSNPKDTCGIKKWRQVTCIPFTVLWEIGLSMMEGARKYGRHNYRVVGVRASVYVDAAMGHIMQWWEGENTDHESGISHLTKAITSLIVLRDAMIQDMFTDDRPPPTELDSFRNRLQGEVDELFERYPEEKAPYITGVDLARGEDHGNP